MDPLEVIENISSVVPHYQPVLNSEEYRIIGYEVLGRIHLNGECLSLGPFFLDRSVPAEYKWEVDKEIHKQAVKFAISHPGKPRLFFNIDPNTLAQLHCLEELMENFEQFYKDGLEKNQVVFEFRVNDYMEEINDLSHMILYMKASGYTVTLDDIKTNDTNLENFSKLEPNIIKIDLSDLKESTNHFTYRDVLSALALFARKIGAALHFKGIQNTHQLRTAWQHGGRYLQGFYLHEPGEIFPDESALKKKLESQIHSFIDLAHKKLERQLSFVSWMDSLMEKTVKEKISSVDQLVEFIAKAADEASFRAYVCDSYGYQKSANWVKTGKTQWVSEESARGKNWSWRTYFLSQIMQMKHRKTGMLSDKYRDIETNELIRTYSYPIGKEQYVFIDLDPVYLFENDWLL
ncbi:EAL-associated domain-containing protein [Salipaludibacillus aurantiacus]|uniref:EAL domain, c-di-GMP-specific phosphodiesterase class I (Or its enzymatically inactive variant) n=1 Tax=Salipaludibacillus aurantiacus TaxID=1601833 RepID=A0A1H9WDI5_9BACI|nr:EAL-associated domain-containing protein [Salipaludibacillus aurantiacus]SES31884.1 EAL domain, c-di-GMP-specific phosphodiesterase class I (or its enzymatically inactive variant) [Salipaludibacillus aurantiacus]